MKVNMCKETRGDQEIYQFSLFFWFYYVTNNIFRTGSLCTSPLGDTAPDPRHPTYIGEKKPAIIGDQQHCQKARLLRQHSRARAFVVLSFCSGSVCRDLSFFMGMDKHIKHKKKKNLKRKLLPSDSAIDKGKGH